MVLANPLLGVEESDLRIEGLQGSYATIDDVRVTLRNVAPVPIYLDSFQPDVFIVERQIDGSESWERGESWNCANAGAGTPRKIPQHGSLELPLRKSWSFQPSKRPSGFETPEGARRPIRGRYRISVRYSREMWTDLVHIPKVVEMVKSSIFEVR
jgi:hypothetical protein